MQWNDVTELDLNQYKPFGWKFENAQKENDMGPMTKVIRDLSRLLKSYDELKIRQIIDSLEGSPFLMKFWLSLEFRSVRDRKFPIFEVFKEYFPDFIQVLENREYIMAFGKNRSFNLGILSDGCPIEEPRLVNIPKCRTILMSNYHTLFLTYDNRVYGCGKSQNFHVGERKKTDISYIAEPKMIEIEEEVEFFSIAVTDKYSVLLARKFVYFIGNCTYALSSKGAKSITSNCVQIPLFSMSWESVKIYVSEKSASLCYFFGYARGWEYVNIGEENDSTLEYDMGFRRVRQKCCVALHKSLPKIEMFLTLEKAEIFYKPINTESFTPLEFLVNLKICNAKPSCFFVNSPGNEIIVQFSKGVIAKGTLQFLKLESDEFVGVRKEKGILDHMVGYHLFAVLTEIPGTFGASVFCASPDLTNLIMQFGVTEEELEQNSEKPYKRHTLQAFLEHEEEVHSQRRISILLEKYRKISNIQEDITVWYIFDKFQRLEIQLGRNIMNFKSSDLEELAFLLDFLRAMMDDRTDLMGSEWDNEIVGCEADSVDFVIERVKMMEKNYIQQKFLSSGHVSDEDYRSNDDERKVTIRRINEARGNHSLNDIELRRDSDLRTMLKIIKKSNDIKCWLEVLTKDPSSSSDSFDSAPSETYAERRRRKKRELKLEFRETNMLQMLDLYIKIITDRMDNDLDIQYCAKFPTKKFRSENIIEIVRNRIEDGDIDEFDIPMDISIKHSEFDLQEMTNAVLFSMIYPKAVQFVQNDVVELDNNELYNYLFNRGRFQDKLESTRQRMFLPEGTDSEEDIVCFVTKDGKTIDIHRYIVTLHSRHISAMQRFTTTQYGLASSSTPKKLQINTDFNAKTVRDALTALLDIRTLFNRKMNELVDILFFFDYFMMFEAVQDTLDVMFQTATPHSVPYLIQLYESFPEDTMERFVKYPYFLLQTKCELSQELFFEFCKKEGRMKRRRDESRMKKEYPELNLKLDKIAFNNKFGADYQDDGYIGSKESFQLPKRIRKSSSRNNSTSESHMSHQGRSRPPSICDPKTIPPSLIDRHIAESPQAHNTQEIRSRVQSICEPKTIPPSPASPIAHNNQPIPSRPPSICESSSGPISEPKTIPGSITKNEAGATSPISMAQSPNFLDFPESPGTSLSIPLIKHKTGGRFIPKGAKLKKANEILQAPEPVNPWSRNRTVSSNNNAIEPVFEGSPSKFEDVMKEEEKMVRIRKGEMKQIRHLPHIEMEDQATMEIDRVFQQQYNSEAKITVELMDDNKDDDEDEPVWGIMPGLLKR